MESFGVGFNYKIEYYRAWIYCSAAMAVSLILTAWTYLTFEYDNYSDVELIYFFGAAISQDSVLILPPITFIFLLRNLHKRFIGLNSILRFGFFVFL